MVGGVPPYELGASDSVLKVTGTPSRPNIIDISGVVAGPRSIVVTVKDSLGQGDSIAITVEQLEVSPNIITRAQQELKTRGFDPGPPDGVMGPRTRGALKAFQKANKLRESGEIDPGRSRPWE